MASLLERVAAERDRPRTGRKEWSEPPFWSLPENLFSALPWSGNREEIEPHFESYVANAYKRSGPIFTCILVRMWVFSEARFQYQQMRGGRPGDLFGNQDLALLENPWPNATTGELLAHMEQDASLAGNFYATTVTDEAGTRIRRLRPDWVTILTGSPTDDPFDIAARPIGYIYEPRTRIARSDPVLLTPEQVVHYSPVPDPAAQWRGMSWITPVVDETKGDSAATRHKLKFFENGTTSNFVVTYDSGLTKDQFLEYVAAYKQAHDGVDNAYKTVHLGGGADVNVVGADMKQLDFKATQGAGESRIAAASGVGAVMAQFSEGMQGSSLNAGNFGAAKRRFADGTMRPLWRMAAASLAKLVAVPSGSRLWYDDRDIPFLRDDQSDVAEIQAKQAQTIRTLVEAGYTQDSVKQAVVAEDWSVLAPTGFVSVQLQPLGGSDAQNGDAQNASNGAGQSRTEDVLNLTRALQQVYLAVVNEVITRDEARAIVNRLGAGLPATSSTPASNGNGRS